MQYHAKNNLHYAVVLSSAMCSAIRTSLLHTHGCLKKLPPPVICHALSMLLLFDLVNEKALVLLWSCQECQLNCCLSEFIKGLAQLKFELWQEMQIQTINRLSALIQVAVIHYPVFS